MTFRAQVVFPFLTNLPSDVVTNTFHFDTLVPPASLDAIADVWTPRLATFYNAVYTSAWTMANYMAADATFHVNWYDLSDPIPRIPDTRPLGATTTRSSTTIPSEVACVLSFQGAPLSGANQARRRGRIYIGGVPNNWFATGSALGPPRFNDQRPETIAAAADVLATAGTSDSWWSVWSPTAGTSTRVTNGWVDNTPDTQRRRGVEPSLRALFSV